MNDPNAIEPKWYLKIHLIPVQSEPLPAVSLVKEKYQTQHAAAMINWEQPIMKALTQSPPNKWYKNMYLVSLPHLTVVANSKGYSLG